ncbi:MAG: hypothetical protein CM1200mP2_18760 [Planctomycetaceae bacterium]|nr:MAG: hypothetical protein CM1200mP2_18760 [Planctomycetaceae bacterium]
MTATDQAGNAGSDATIYELIINTTSDTMLLGADVFLAAAGNEVRLIVDGDQLRAVDQGGTDLVPSRTLSQIPRSMSPDKPTQRTPW